MTAVAEVLLWGRTIGAVSLDEGAEAAAFEYDREFAQSGIEVSPITMPLSRRIFTFPDLADKTFHGLSGLLADSLPDRFGNALIDTWLAQQGRTPASFNAIERLCYTGDRGMGALEYKPATGSGRSESRGLQVDHLLELACEILTPEQFKVCRRKGTEPAFTGKLNRIPGHGTFVCIACGQDLFQSVDKFDSGTGWPSFFPAHRRRRGRLPGRRQFYDA